MLGPGQHSLKFFVYIVESPSAPDLYHGRSEGSLVERALSLNGIRCITRTAINAEAFTAALKIGLPEAMKEVPDRLPIVHLSAHGGPKGLQLSDGSLIDWENLRELIEPINAGLAGELLLCMSACEGYGACQMAMRVGEDPHPYWGIVGNYAKPTWSDTAVAYSAFYHLLSKGFVLGDCVDGMKAASGDEKWVWERAEETKQSFLEFNKVDLPAARRELEADAERSDIPPNAKALEAGVGG